MAPFPEPGPAGRFFVFACAVAFYILAVVVYFHGVTGFSTGVYFLSILGTVYMAIFLFGSDSACCVAAQVTTLGGWGGSL